MNNAIPPPPRDCHARSSSAPGAFRACTRLVSSRIPQTRLMISVAGDRGSVREEHSALGSLRLPSAHSTRSALATRV
jgi:hypothetical protein